MPASCPGCPTGPEHHDGIAAVRPLRRKLSADLGDGGGHLVPEVDQLLQLRAKSLQLLTVLPDLLLDPSRVATDQLVGLLRRRPRRFAGLLFLGETLTGVPAGLGLHGPPGYQAENDHQAKTGNIPHHGVDSIGEI